VLTLANGLSAEGRNKLGRLVVELAILVSLPRWAPMDGEEDHAEAESQFATLVTHPLLRDSVSRKRFTVLVALSFGPATGMKSDERQRPRGRNSGRADHYHSARDERHDHLSKISGRPAY